MQRGDFRGRDRGGTCPGRRNFRGIKFQINNVTDIIIF